MPLKENGERWEQQGKEEIVLRWASIRAAARQILATDWVISASRQYYNTLHIGTSTESELVLRGVSETKDLDLKYSQYNSQIIEDINPEKKNLFTTPTNDCQHYRGSL